MKTYPYDFTQTELGVLLALATLRQAVWDKNPYAVDKRFDKSRDNVELHYIGLRGEYAAASLLGVRMFLPVAETSDPGYDMLYRGYRIDVKCGRRFLIVRDWRTIKADALLFVRHFSPEPQVEVVGWMNRKQFISQCREMEFAFGKVYGVDASKLRGVDELLGLPTNTQA